MWHGGTIEIRGCHWVPRTNATVAIVPMVNDITATNNIRPSCVWFAHVVLRTVPICVTCCAFPLNEFDTDVVLHAEWSLLLSHVLLCIPSVGIAFNVEVECRGCSLRFSQGPLWPCRGDPCRIRLPWCCGAG